LDDFVTEAGLHVVQTWVVTIAATVAVLATVLGVIIKMARSHIDIRTRTTVREELDRQMGPLRLELSTMNGEIGRVRVLEQKIENGLNDRLHRTEKKVDQIIRQMEDC
jgi:hypothetical protein